MAILKIARMGHPVLRAQATPVDDVRARDVQQLIADMKDTLADAQGVGLAAPQVHVSRRLFIYYVPPSRVAAEDAPADGVPLSVLINPEITPVGADRDLDWEGCLSMPGLLGEVSRWRRIRYAGLDEQGRPVRGEAHGFHARVIQHEYDHLEGRLYPERMGDLTRLGFADEIRRYGL